LRLRAPQTADARSIVPMIGDFEIAKNLSSAPHPYFETDWYELLDRVNEGHARGTDFTFVITRASDGAVMGMCGVHWRDGGFFEIGYWLGRPHWGEGFATEAARRISAFAFHDLKVETLVAGYFADNPASGRVLAKLGFAPDGMRIKDSRARKAPVECNMMLLPREHFGRRRIAA
jgi:RimJ/RimL family protein N-acetyltransferase